MDVVDIDGVHLSMLLSSVPASLTELKSGRQRNFHVLGAFQLSAIVIIQKSRHQATVFLKF